MKTAAMVGVACALGGLAASAALGQVSVPTPTVSVPTVSVPSVTVPVPPPPPPVPTVPVPTVPTPPPPPPVPTVPAPTVRTPTVSTPITTTSVQVTPSAPVVGGSPGGSAPSGSSSSGSTSYGSAPGTSSSAAASGSPAAVGAAAAAAGAPRGRVTRSWIAVRGADKRTQATLVFRLGRKRAVMITVVQVSPVCRVAAKFRVGGHAGTNRVTVGRGAHGLQLTPGTYRVVGRTRDGRTVLRQTIVVVQARAPSSAELAAARRSNVCGASGVMGAPGTTGSLASLSGPGGPSQSTIRRHQRQSDEGAGSADTGRPIASGISDAVKQAARSPFVIALLALAFLMFGVAALPRTAVADPRMMAAVASHRAEVAVAGAGVLVIAVIAMLVG